MLFPEKITKRKEDERKYLIVIIIPTVACLFPNYTPTQLTSPFYRTTLLWAGYGLLSLLPCADSTGWSHRSTSEGRIWPQDPIFCF